MNDRNNEPNDVDYSPDNYQAESPESPETNDPDYVPSNVDSSPTGYHHDTSLEEQNNSFDGNLPTSANYDALKCAKKRLNFQIRNPTEGRVLGKSYIGFQNTEKKSKIFERVKKNGRMIQPRCSHKTEKSKSDRTFLCFTFTDEDREFAFRTFWSYPTWQEKKAFIKGLVSTRAITRRRLEVKSKTPKKNFGHDIYLCRQDGTKVKVCRKFFLATLNFGEDSFKRWTKDDDKDIDVDENLDDQSDLLEDEFECQGQTSLVEEPTVKKRGRKKGESPSAKSLEEWFLVLPKVPSHYCRASSNKVYVESTFTSFRHMYRVYSEWCTEQNKKKAGRDAFKMRIKKENIGIHSPRKDQCDLCLGYEHGTVEEDIYKAHFNRKQEGRKLKNYFKKKANDSTLVVTMDLQSVLLSPKTLASAMYYKTKLQVHNFSIYELGTKNVELYVWDESEGGVTANEFVSCIIDYIQKRLNFKKIVLISDGCSYQNRNRVLSSALICAAKEYGIEIQQVILEKGHTMMEVDTVHSVLEHVFKPPIYTPSDYYSRMQLARPDQPFNVNVINHEFFKDYTKTCTISSIRPGTKAGDSVVTDIRRLCYEPTGCIYYSLDYSNDWKTLPCSFQISTLRNCPKLYSDTIPIEESKYRHLQELKSVIPLAYHAFYDNLTFVKKNVNKRKKSLNVVM